MTNMAVFGEREKAYLHVNKVNRAHSFLTNKMKWTNPYATRVLLKKKKLVKCIWPVKCTKSSVPLVWYSKCIYLEFPDLQPVFLCHFSFLSMSAPYRIVDLHENQHTV